MKNLVIAIDGPAGAGKSTVAQLVAQQLEYLYIDTGAMYRAIAYLSLHSQIGILTAIDNIKLSLTYVDGITKVYLNDENITEEIRTPEVTKLVSSIAQEPKVREKLIAIQREMAKNGKVVMDGRDICSNVLPNADVKIFLTASIAERARRRWLELSKKGYDIDLAQIQQEIAARDKMDMEREIAPLQQAPDVSGHRIVLSGTGSSQLLVQLSAGSMSEV